MAAIEHQDLPAQTTPEKLWATHVPVRPQTPTMLGRSKGCAWIV